MIYKILKVLSFGAMVIGGIVLLLRQKQKENRCTEERVCPLVEVRDEVRNVNRKRKHYSLGTIEFNGYGRIICGEVELPAGAKVGNTVTIRFNPDNPAEFTYGGESFSNATLGWVFIVVGAIAVVISILYG